MPLHVSFCELSYDKNWNLTLYQNILSIFSLSLFRCECVYVLEWGWGGVGVGLRAGVGGDFG